MLHERCRTAHEILSPPFLVFSDCLLRNSLHLPFYGVIVVCGWIVLAGRSSFRIVVAKPEDLGPDQEEESTIRNQRNALKVENLGGGGKYLVSVTPSFASDSSCCAFLLRSARSFSLRATFASSSDMINRSRSSDNINDVEEVLSSCHHTLSISATAAYVSYPRLGGFRFAQVECSSTYLSHRAQVSC